MLVDFLQNHFDDPGAVHDIIWSDGPLSVFKKKFMTKFFPWLSQKHERVFSGKYFLKSHGKGVVDGISGKTKAYFQFLKKLKLKGMTKSLLSHQIIFQKQQSSYCTKQNRSYSHLTGRNFLKNIRSYWLEPDKIRITGST